jgi:hypothetical protein
MYLRLQGEQCVLPLKPLNDIIDIL